MKVSSQTQNWVLMGATSGLGFEFSKTVSQCLPGVSISNFSRRTEHAFDFSDEKSWPEIFQVISMRKPTRLLYFAGGGPWGPYTEKKWQSHLWTYRVNFLLPAYLLAQKWHADLQQVLFVGSAIAENQPDPGAASYSASKHALKGLVLNLQAEKSLPYDLRLFSPTYMDTPLLPKNAWPRQEGLAQSPQKVSEVLFHWLLDDTKKNQHFVMSQSLSKR